MIEALRTISALCLIIIVTNVLSLLESQFPRIEAWFYSYVGFAGAYILMDLATFGFLILGSLRRSIS